MVERLSSEARTAAVAELTGWAEVPGREAALSAGEGDPSMDVGALRRVRFGLLKGRIVRED